MSDRVLDHQIKVLSGQAEQELEQEKLSLVADIARQKAERQELRRIRTGMEAAADCAPLLPTVAALTEHERRNYSISRLVQAFVAPKGKEKTLEREISDGITADLKTFPPHGGVWLPFQISASGLDRKTNAGGGYLTASRVSSNIVDALRANCAILQLGATFLTGLRQNFELPVEDNVLSGSWISENPGADVAQSDPSFALRILSPHPLQGTTSVSRQLLTQSSPDLEAWLRNRLARAHGLLLDRAAIHGSGVSNEPVGILANSRISTVAIGQNGGAVAASHLIAMEKAVSDANADMGALAWLTNSSQRAALRTVPEFAGATTPLWDDSSLLDYPAVVSNQASRVLSKGTSVGNCSAVIFGDWSSLMVAEFNGAMEVCYDPFSQKKRGMVELTSYGAYDVGIQQPGSFAACVDAI